MPTADEFWRVAAQVASERGGLVVGFAKGSEQPELGSALDNVLGFAPQSPVRVTGLSDWADWVEQVEAFYHLRPDWGRGKRGVADANYYRVKFDEFDASTNSASSTSFRTSSPFSTAFDIPSFGGYAAPLSGFQGVTFWPRLLARGIDIAIHYLASLLAAFLFVLILAVSAGGRPPAWVLQRLSQTHFATFVAGLLGLFAYQVACTSIHGSTLGKLLLSMQVIQDDGSPCRLKSAIIRELGYFVDAMFFGVVGYFAMREDPEQKRHGDRWADTIVCKRALVPSASKRGGMQFALGLLLGIAADIALMMTGLLIQMNS
ncbi:MAG TPA: RDD family protein [Candidatus Sulfotelmatobacter sp.]|nr:RDD family protein [Candidatus Sulfotelmatobacter sp.]